MRRIDKLEKRLRAAVKECEKLSEGTLVERAVAVGALVGIDLAVKNVRNVLQKEVSKNEKK